MKEFETERLILRKIKLSDSEEMFNSWCNDPEVCKYLPWNVHGNIEVTKELVNLWVSEYNSPDTYRWIVVLKETNGINIEDIKKLGATGIVQNQNKVSMIFGKVSETLEEELKQAIKDSEK